MDKLTKKNLYEICEQLNIVKYKSKTKAELIELIDKNQNKNKEDNCHLDSKNKLNIENSTYDILKDLYDNVLNVDKSTFQSTNDEPTPIKCIEEMLNKIPEDLWKDKNIKILDPCCGNGNFSLCILYKLLKYHNMKHIMENMLYFNDINKNRLSNVEKIFCNDKFLLNITDKDYTIFDENVKYDLIVANPPYAKILENGKRASKNHNLISVFLEKTLSLLKKDGYLLFITPDNWMSYADRNTLIKRITQLQIIHLDIHNAKKHFKKIGSSFTWYIIQNKKNYKDINISGIWKNKYYESQVPSIGRSYIPLFYNKTIYDILLKTIDNENLTKFNVQTSSDLHKYTKSQFINDKENEVYKYKLIHTPTQTVWSSKPHKYQDGYKVFISTTNKYKVFVDNCGMTQSILFISCKNKNEAELYEKLLNHPLYIFINNICRWGNFNNIRIIQHFPFPNINYSGNINEIYNYFNINEQEINFINENL